MRFPGIRPLIDSLLPERYKPFMEPMIWGFVGGMLAGAFLVAIPALVITGQEVGNGPVGWVAIAAMCLGGLVGAWLAGRFVAKRHGESPAPSPRSSAALQSPVLRGDWYPDPTGRHALRYRDGTRWSGYVSDAGVQSQDLIGAMDDETRALGFELGEQALILSGPFADFNGAIIEIDTDRSKLTVLLDIFGRKSQVELEFDQVAKF